MTAIPKIRRPTAVHTTDQIVSMASRLGWTVGITGDDLVGAQCRAVIGLAPQDEKFLAGENYVGVWHGTAEDARKRQEALDVVPYGQYQAMAVSPLTSGRLNPPDICLVYATPGQMIILINGLQYTGYKKFEWGVVGETACADSWGRALKTGEPSLSLPCFAERRYGGVPDEEMLMALQAGASRQGDRRHEAACQERPALSDRALWYPGRRARRHGRVLREEIGLRKRQNRHCEERSDEAIHAATQDSMDCFASLAMTDSNDDQPKETQNMSSSKFDIVVYGATGFTGQLVAEYLAAHYKGDAQSEMGDGRAQQGQARLRPRRDRRAGRHAADRGRRQRSRFAEGDGRSDQVRDQHGRPVSALWQRTACGLRGLGHRLFRSLRRAALDAADDRQA